MMNEIIVVKTLKELYNIFLWLFDNVEDWETLEFDKEKHQRVGYGYINKNSAQDWKDFDFKKYWAIQKYNQDYVVGTIFVFKNSNDAMMFKLRWG